MIKEFKINEILDAVNNISKKEKSSTKIGEKNNSTNKDDTLTLNRRSKPNKTEVLVLDQMIE